jgi:hypothetical protein
MRATLVLLSTNVAAMRTQPADPGPAKMMKAVTDDLPSIMETVPMVESFWRGHHSLTDALRSAFSTPLHNVSSFKELESLWKVALMQSGAVRDAKELAAKLKSGSVEADSVNIGLARSFAPYPAFVEDTAIDTFPLHAIGGVTFFLNIVTHTETETGDEKNPTAKNGDARLCVALGGGGSLYFSGEGSAGMKGFKGTEYGGEDFYFGFAKVKNVPGMSWAMNFNRDYVDSGMKFGRLAYAYQTAEYFQRIKKSWHPWTVLSSLSGGFELTTV